MLSKTTGENYVGQLPTHVSQSLKFIQILRDSNKELFDGYEDILHTFHFHKQIILRAKRGILLATPSMNGHFGYATDMTYETNNKDYSFVFDCLNDLLATIELQGNYRTEQEFFSTKNSIIEFENKSILHVVYEGEEFFDENGEESIYKYLLFVKK